jgi:hypothetical protein
MDLPLQLGMAVEKLPDDGRIISAERLFQFLDRVA